MNNRSVLNMPLVAFNTLAYANKLKLAGVDPKQAEVQAEVTAEAMNEFANNQFVTKSDLQEVKQDLMAFRQDVEIFKIEVKSEFADIRKELKSLRPYIGTVEVDLKKDTISLGSVLRKEMETQGTVLRKDMDLLHADLKKDISVLQVSLKAIDSKLNWLVSLVGVIGVGLTLFNFFT